ncbi:cytoplasmic tRNA 2-thiolation protein 2 [Anoplophora glabripennis]|uniref:cytoplasmic tRNA 2-thiolation protein 2 n=1 Tax=Anoplophora glabripennis TaxID=217634 RepID=UPI000874B290|nr:cytoplasmic tRNA 2-thiolation protein 2 [Anoplophora glabripennis]
MCNVGDDNFENDVANVMVQKDIVKLSNSSTCNKCRLEKACVVLRHKDAYCKSCFLAGAVHKFKALLGKSRLIHINDQVLIYHKIGHPSTALLHFLRTGLDLNTHKKLRFKPIVLFVEDQIQLNREQRKEILKQVEKEVTSFGFKFYCVSFVDYVLNPSSVQENICSNKVNITENDKQKLQSVLDKKTSKTNSNDLIKLFKRQLLVDAAKSLDCKFVFTPEISVDIASNLLTNISLGRGCHVPIDTGFCDDRDDVKLLRPLRLFDMKELALYNKFNGLEPLSIPYFEVNPYASVQDLMIKFVNDLQQNFPATITTIMKTGDKLSLDKGITDICTLCKGALPKKSSELTSEESTSFSRIVSTKTLDYTHSRQERYQDILGDYESQKVSENGYCYACTKIKPYIL